jgi:hypothetical protein
MGFSVYGLFGIGAFRYRGFWVYGLFGSHPTKLWFAEPDRTLSRDILQRSKAKLGQLVQFFTGHNNLMKHQFNINNDVDSTCRLCLEDEETSWHVIAECPALIKKGGKFSTNQSYIILQTGQ